MKNPDVYDLIVSNHVLANCRPTLLEKFTICYFTENIDPLNERSIFEPHNACYYVQDSHGALFIPVFPELFEKHNPVNKDEYITFNDEETKVVYDDSGSFRIEFTFSTPEERETDMSLISCIQMPEETLMTDIGDSFLITEVTLQMYIVFQDNIDEILYGCFRYENDIDGQTEEDYSNEQNYISNMMTIGAGSCVTSDDRLAIKEFRPDKSKIVFYIDSETPSTECVMYFHNILPSVGIHPDDFEVSVTGHELTLTLFKDNLMYHDFESMNGFRNDNLN